MRKLLLALCMIVGFTSVVLAISGGISGTQVNVVYVEPSTNEVDYLGNTTTLDDLHHTSIYYQVVGSTTSVMALAVPATSASGGGSVNKNIVVPMQAKRKMAYTFWATATDVTGNESVASPTFSVIIDMLAPAAPK
jgi:hypothetical protein